MWYKQPNKNPRSPQSATTTDLLEKIQKMSDEWFIKGLPPRPQEESETQESKEKSEQDNFPKPL